MITAIQFKNYKVLRDCTLPLGRFTLIVGANGTGKSTALEALRSGSIFQEYEKIATVGVSPAELSISLSWDGMMVVGRRQSPGHRDRDAYTQSTDINDLVWNVASRTIIYNLDATKVAVPVTLAPKMVLDPSGAGLAGVLDRLRDQHPERFDELNEQLALWLPEFDRVLFDTPAPGQRAFKLRTRSGHSIPAIDLSQGTLLALAMLAIAYLPSPPPIVGFEEPDRGIHPRLLRDVRDALYRLAYPESVGEKRDPVQVIATTHSPYLLDLFRDHPDEIVIAQRVGDNIKFERLSDRPDLDEILQSGHLGDVWYSGVLGGVPDER